MLIYSYDMVFPEGRYSEIFRKVPRIMKRVLGSAKQTTKSFESIKEKKEKRKKIHIIYTNTYLYIYIYIHIYI